MLLCICRPFHDDQGNGCWRKHGFCRYIISDTICNTNGYCTFPWVTEAAEVAISSDGFLTFIGTGCGREVNTGDYMTNDPYFVLTSSRTLCRDAAHHMTRA